MEIELILKAENTQYIKGIKDAQKATQELHTTADAGAKKQQESIEDLTKEYDKLWKEAGKGFSSVKALTDYAKRTEEIKKKIIELTAVEKRATTEREKLAKSTDKFGEAALNLTKKLGPIAIAIAVITKISGAVIQAFKDTTLGMNLMTKAGELWTQMSYNIATGNFFMAQSLVFALGIAKQSNDLRKQERIDLLESSKLRSQYNKLYFETSDRTQEDTIRLEKINEAMETHNKLIDIELKSTDKRLTIVAQQLINRPKSNKLLDQEIKLLAERETIESRRYSEIRFLEAARGIEEKQIHDKKLKRWHDEIEASNEFYQLSLKLQDDYDKSNIESLTGEAKLKAQREFGIKQIKEFRDQLAELGTITDEQMALFEKMGENVWKIYYEGIAKQAKPTAAQKEAITKSLLAGLPTLEGLQKSYIRTIEDVSPLDKEFSLWNIIGLKPEDEEEQEIIDAIKETAGKVGDVLDDIFQRRVDDAQRTRELLDIRIAETQRSLELEMDLLEEGYANNVDAKKREVEALKKQRDAALKAEEKAIKQEQLLAKISQTTNILSGVSDIIKIYSKIPIVGLILAAAAIASLFAIWGKAKSSASSATFAEGASGTEKGIITGKSHAAGGERFLDHVEVERGEAFGVLSRKATDKYGKVFHNMVSSFNRDEMPDILMGASVVNSPVTVENSGPNSRLDKVITEQRKLNEQFGRQTQMSTSGNKRIIKQGNKIRIIG